MISLMLVVSVVPMAQLPAAGPQAAVVRDSIYALAVEPSKYPEDAVVWLLDEGVYRIEPVGRSRLTFRKVVQIL